LCLFEVADFFSSDPIRIFEMPRSEFEKWYAAMSILKAREYKSQMSIADHPHQKDASRRDRIEALDRSIANYMPRKVLSMDDLIEELSDGHA